MLRHLLNRLTGRPPKKQFKLGDKVEFFGAIGTVISTDGPPPCKTQVLFMGPRLVVGFFPDGRFFEWQTKGALKFLARRTLEFKELANPVALKPEVSNESGST